MVECLFAELPLDGTVQALRGEKKENAKIKDRRLALSKGHYVPRCSQDPNLQKKTLQLRPELAIFANAPRAVLSQALKPVRIKK